MSKKILLALCACITPLFFPWQVVAVVAVVASWFLPLTALAVGLIEDLLYAPTTSSHHALFFGAGVMLVMFGVRYFVRTRIMQG